MLYHFNDVEDRESDYLSVSYRAGDYNTRKYSFSSHIRSSDFKRRYNEAFSDVFESMKESKQTILQVVFPKKSAIILIVYLTIFVFYLYLGAFCFHALESNKEKEDRSTFYLFKMEFLKNNTCIKNNDLEKFISQVQLLSGRGISVLGNATVNHYNWDFTNAVFFATSLVTTIGYGNDKPVTTAGRIFCIIFVIFGIPMMMIMTSAVVERLFLLVDLSFSAACSRFQWRITENRFREIQIVFSFLCLMTFFYLIPALAFTEIENHNWSFLDSLYFCVISLTTIGLGDLVPGDGDDLDKRDLSRILATIYLFTGLLATSFFIRVFHRHNKWNLGERFIYLNDNTYEMHKFETDTTSYLSDVSSSPDLSDQVISFPPVQPLIKSSKKTRPRYNSIS